MNWNNQGGGWRGGPWGQGGGNQNPDLDEILRRGQDKLNSILPGGAGNGFLLLAVLAFIVIGWLSQAVYQVKPEERGVEFVFGKPKQEISDPGLHFLAWPVETVKLVNIEQMREVIGGRGSQSLMLSGDQNIVDVDFTVLWRVVDPADFIIRVNGPRDLMRRVGESAMREYIGRSRGEDVRTERRQQLEETVREQLQETLDSYRMGIAVDGVQLERADPPADVADAFEEVQRAQQDQEKFKQEAQAYANKRLGDSRGASSQILEQGKGYKARMVAEAQGEAQRFLSVYSEYAKAKDVTRERLFLETMELVLGRSSKVIIEDGASRSGVVPYLPLPEVNKKAKAGQ